ncbi:MAG: CcoQ/FixQ family Cbb3-type cytochrome c oxidase assembly chaperone [Gammaproteobacteria bacterium]|nr:CcoQ/FixQ family Cbb3-type cytochrome c oxidase assembly chaperone [Gammaproteobacteria bacterium]
MTMADFHSYYTVLILIVFIGIWFWAWSGKRKRFFNEAANLPFADEEISERSALKLQEEEKDRE